MSGVSLTHEADVGFFGMIQLDCSHLKSFTSELNVYFIVVIGV
jgi:hypothetical protein